MNVTYDFKGKTVLVTGGVSGIGLATTNAFAASGATVVVWDYSDAKVETRGVMTRRVDLRSTADVESAAAEVLEAHGCVDILINNAGINFGEQGITKISDETWNGIIETNLKGAVNAVRALAPAMIARKWGRIVNTGSIQAINPVARFSAYAASKAGIVALTKVWARELGPSGITVNTISPGFVETAMNARMHFGKRNDLLQRTGLRRVARPEEIASVHLFLASEGASFINGADIPVDGDLSL